MGWGKKERQMRDKTRTGEKRGEKRRGDVVRKDKRRDKKAEIRGKRGKRLEEKQREQT